MMETGNSERRCRCGRSFSGGPEVQRVGWRRDPRRGTDRAVPVVDKPYPGKTNLLVIEQRSKEAFERHGRLFGLRYREKGTFKAHGGI